MRTSDSVEIKNGSNVWIAYPTIKNGGFKPIRVNMYDQRAHFKHWYNNKINCQAECDKLNKMHNEKIKQPIYDRFCKRIIRAFK